RALLQEVVQHYVLFSSRRRHTRSTRDWSSDVCSSDLFVDTVGAYVLYLDNTDLSPREVNAELQAIPNQGDRQTYAFDQGLKWIRSEERRVGKESRCPRAWSDCQINEAEVATDASCRVR